jgi:membrane-bound lytic murein transglycosylase B
MIEPVVDADKGRGKRMSQASSGRWAARHQPRHARMPGLTLTRTAICLALLAGLTLAVALPGSGGPAGGIARAAVPHALATQPPAVSAEQDVQRGATSPVAGLEHSLATPGKTASKVRNLGVAEISDRFPASGLAADGIPVTALKAYESAAARETTRAPACGITWPLLAGIGRVESDHGRFAGAVLHSDGLSTPRVIGIPLDGHGTALIRDTDDGVLDGDTVYDRAVGPMQFIPSTWASWGIDANGDGVKDPFNIFDAAAAAADYLCAAGRDLTTTHGQVQAILSYNWSWDYVRTVMSLEKVYASGAVGITVPVLPTTPDRHGTPKHKPSLPPVDPGPPVGVRSSGGTPKQKPSPSPSPTRTSAHSAPSGSTTSTAPGGSGSGSGSSSGSSSGSGSGSGSASSSGSPSPSQPDCPTDVPTPAPSDSPSPVPSGCPSTSDSSSSSGQLSQQGSAATSSSAAPSSSGP